MPKYKTHDGVEVKAELSENVWHITFPDGSVKEMVDVDQFGEPVFVNNFEAVT